MQMRPNKVLLFLIGLILTGSIFSVLADASVSTTTIIKKTVVAAINDPLSNYLNYRIIGVCFWQEGPWWNPFLSMTFKVDHFLPDAVVSVYNGYQQNPWDYANDIIDPVTYQAGKTMTRSMVSLDPSFGTSSSDAEPNKMKQFREVDIVGNPGVSVLIHTLPLAFIKSEATSFFPYYSSLADAYLWHDPYLENITHPEYLIPGVRLEGSLLDQWGNIFPRIGFLNQFGGFKAAAVMVLRAADIATNDNQGHIYHALHSGSCGHECQVWPSHENDFSNVKYQEIYPESMIKAKKRFGVLETGNDAEQSEEVKGDGNYVFVMWRHYKGCIQHGGRFIGSVNW